MKKLNYFTACMLLASATFFACESDQVMKEETVSPEVMARLTDLGFDVTDQAPLIFEEGYLVEGDIYLTDADLG